MTDPVITTPPDVPPAAPPTVDAAGVWTVTRHADVHAVLTDPAFEVPVAESGPLGTLAWLRGAVARFSPAGRHPRRRAWAVDALAALDPDLLRRDAARGTAALPDAARGTAAPPDAARDDGSAGPVPGSDPVGPLRGVPVRVLATHLGLADPAAAVPAVMAVAAAYQPGAGAAAVRRADGAVAALLAMLPPAPPEAAANRIGLLVQACDATAGLIAAALRYAPTVPRTVPTEALLAAVLRADPPVRGTRRQSVAATVLGGRSIPAGADLVLRLDAANRDRDADPLSFGAGPHACPGRWHALALAAGVLDAVRDGLLDAGERR